MALASALFAAASDETPRITALRAIPAPTENPYLDRVIRFGFGGTALGEKAELKQEREGRFRYGDWTTILHASNFASTKLETVPFRRPQAPVSEIVLRDERSPTASGRIDYPADHPYTFVAEIRAGNGPDAVVEQLPAPAGLFALSLQIDEKTHIAWLNAGTDARTIQIRAPAGPASLWRSEKPTLPSRDIPDSVTLAPGSAFLIIRSHDEADHLPGWTSFETMVAPSPAP